MRAYFSALPLFLLLSLPAPAAPSLPLEAYKEQVEAAKPGLKASELASEGYQRMAEGAIVLTFPYLFGNFTNFDDRQETPNPAFQGDRTEGRQFTVGAGMNTPLGLQARYSFNVANTEIRNATAIPLPTYYTSYNKLELVQPLVKNGFGSEIRAQKRLLESSNLARSYSNRYSAVAQLVEAESTYWRLAFARRAVEMQKGILARSNRVLQWAKRRVSLQLGDRADLLQAQSVFDLRRIELLSAEEEERNAARAFNLLRKVESATVSEELKIPALEETLAMEAPAKEGSRLDVKAAEQEKEANAASLQLDKEKVKPSVDLFANLAWTGRDRSRSGAIDEALGSKRSNIALGLNFTVPLAAPQILSALKGNSMASEAAQLQFEQRRLEEAQDWSELQSRLADAKARLALLRTVENVQREKYENEQQRLLRGRTTTYQAISFEQDYSVTLLSTLRAQNEVLQLLARMKLHRGEL